MKKIFILTLVLSLMLFAVSAFADTTLSVDYDSTTLEAMVSATLPDASNKVYALICAQYSEPPTGNNARTLLTSADSVVAYDHPTTGADGKINYTFSIDENAPLGEYYVIVTDGKNMLSNTFIYYSEAAMTDFIKNLNRISSESEYADEVVDAYYQNRLPIMPAKFDELSDEQKREVASILFDSKTNDIVEFKTVCEEAINITIINNSDDIIGAIVAVAGDIGIDISDWEELTDNQREYFESIMADDFESYDEITDSYYEGIVLSIASKPETYMDIKDALTMYEDYSIDMKGDYEKLSNKNAVFKKMLSDDYESMDELQQGFDDAVAAQKKDEKNQTSSNKGSGGGGGGGYNSATVAKPESKDDTQTVVKDLFNDLKGFEWGEDAINDLASKNIIKGDGNGKFRPGDSVTRAEFVKMLVLALGVNNTKAEAEFADVSEDNWAYPYIASASSLGIINGVGEGLFAPDALITREDMSVIVHRAATLFAIEFEGESTTFDDGDSISSYAKNAVSALSGAGIIKGSDSKFMPKDNTNRAQAAVVIYRVLPLLD